MRIVGAEFRDAAIAALIDRTPLTAADRYTAAARHALADADEGTGVGPGKRSGDSLRWYATAALCLRVGGAEARARYRCTEGGAIALDCRDVAGSTAEKAVCEEYYGDLWAVLDADRARSAYDRAADLYRQAEVTDPLDFATRPFAQTAIGFLQHAARNTGIDTEWDIVHGADPASREYLVRRPAYKRRVMSRVIEAVIEAGELHAPRGSTEHNNATWVCPKCGGSEVNWIAGEIVCLDCSVRMERE